ncbi:MAG: type II secretion system major pseudopilin GspG [Hyphomonadaceae bacterium]
MTNRQPKKRNRRLHPEAGVTLVEMMVVIFIIGLITAIVAINVLPSQDKARVEKAKADIAAIDQALTLFHLEAARYPTMEEGLEALAKPEAALGARRDPFIRSLPNDPWNRAYQYVTPGQNGPYDLYSLGADGKVGGEGLDADVSANS